MEQCLNVWPRHKTLFEKQTCVELAMSLKHLTTFSVCHQQKFLTRIFRDVAKRSNNVFYKLFDEQCLIVRPGPTFEFCQAMFDRLAPLQNIAPETELFERLFFLLQ